MQKVPSIRKLIADTAIKKVQDYNDAVTSTNKDKIMKVSLSAKMASPNFISSAHSTQKDEEPKNNMIKKETIGEQSKKTQTISQERRSKNRIYLKSISTKMAIERTTGKKNEPMNVVMKSAKPKKFKEVLESSKANDWKTVTKNSVQTSQSLKPISNHTSQTAKSLKFDQEAEYL